MDVLRSILAGILGFVLVGLPPVMVIVRGRRVLRRPRAEDDSSDNFATAS